MKLFYLASVLFATLFGITQINAEGYYCTKHIVIQHGDRCNMIYGQDKRKKYYTRYKDLIIINPTMDCNNLKSGQKVCVEVDTNKTPDADLYYIKKGDTCEKLADKFGTTIKVLQNINNYLNCTRGNLDSQIDVVIAYRKDGKYEPNLTQSELVNIIG